MAQKIAFITGGNRGLGFQTALDLGKNREENIKVVIGSRDKAQGEQAVTKLRAAGVDADTIQFDITKHADYQAAYDYFDSKYGKLDILGTTQESPAASSRARALNIEPPMCQWTCCERFLKQTSLRRLSWTEKLLPLIKKSPAGRIVNLSSILGSLQLHAIPSRRSTTPSRSPTMPRRPRSMPSRCILPMNCGIQRSRKSAHPGWVKTDMGGESAPMELSEGGKTSAALATLATDGPTGGYFHMGKPLPW